MGEDGGGGAILEHTTAEGPSAFAANLFVMDLLYRLALSIL